MINLEQMLIERDNAEKNNIEGDAETDYLIEILDDEITNEIMR